MQYYLKLVQIFGFYCCLCSIALAEEGSSKQPARADFTISRSSFVAIRTSNLEMSTSWYRDVLGLQLIKKIEDPQRNYAAHVLSGQGFTLELVNTPNPPKMLKEPVGIFKAGFYVDDIDAAHVWFKDSGVAVWENIFHDKELFVRTFVFADGEGNRIQVFQGCDSVEC